MVPHWGWHEFELKTVRSKRGGYRGPATNIQRRGQAESSSKEGGATRAGTGRASDRDGASGSGKAVGDGGDGDSWKKRVKKEKEKTRKRKRRMPKGRESETSF